MGIFDALKGLFGGTQHNAATDSAGQPYPPENYFIKPDWANEDEDIDDDLVMRRPHNHSNMFSIFSNPLEIHRYFEQQMDEMTKHFEQVFSGHSGKSIFGQMSPFGSEHMPTLLPPTIEEKVSLREKCLKPEARQHGDTAGDSDLDKEFKSGQLKLFKSPGAPQNPSSNNPQVFSSQIFTRVVRHPDGSIEEIRTKQIGDQKYTKVTRTDSAGNTNIHEDLVNIDDDQLKDFQSDSPLPKIDRFGDWFRFRL